MADSDSAIAWHRVQIKRLKETLRDVEAGKVAIGETAGSGKSRRSKYAIDDLKRQIRQSEQIVDAYERLNIKRPRGTDSQSLASVRGT